MCAVDCVCVCDIICDVCNVLLRVGDGNGDGCDGWSSFHVPVHVYVLRSIN